MDPEWFVPYQPLFNGGHAQTLAGNYWRRPQFLLHSESESVEVDPSDGSRVLCHCHWQPEPARSEALSVLLIHGLEGSSDSQYILGITALAWRAGCNVIRMNMRNCGGTDTWTPTLYHSGLSSDVHAVLAHLAQKFALQRVAMAGYSMGGNLVLKLAGELGRSVPPWLIGAVGVSPAADLAASADALHEPQNRIYERHFLRNLMRRFRRKAALYPQIYSVGEAGQPRTIREFDEKITAPYSGFTGADDYYARSSSARVVSTIVLPTLVLHAFDDPFIRLTSTTRSALEANTAVKFIETQHGGHCAFLAKTRSAKTGDNALNSSRHWAESTLLRFLLAQHGPTDAGERVGS